MSSKRIKKAPPVPKVKVVSVGRTLNLGNYQSARIDLQAEVPPGGTFDETYQFLQGEIDRKLCSLKNHPSTAHCRCCCTCALCANCRSKL